MLDYLTSSSADQLIKRLNIFALNSLSQLPSTIA